MKHSDFIAWKARLHELSEEQRNQIIASLKVLGVREISTGIDISNDDWFTKGLIIALQKNLSLSKAEEYKLRKGKVFKEYQKHVPEILKKLNTLLPKNSDISNSKASLSYLAGFSLIKWCYDIPQWYKDGTTWKAKPVTAQRVFSEAHNVIRALDSQFPGYVQANLFGLVFESLKGGNNASRKIARIKDTKKRVSTKKDN